MTEFKHTPGPWFDDGYRIHAPTEDHDKRNGRVIMEYKLAEGFNDADASLISASPEMFEALAYAVEVLEVPQLRALLGTEWLDEAKAALAKARAKD